ncbi:GNAT family N-acetyltransferase [Alteromonas sp. 345S023]|uniref:GNAT family N-acetyltransferase n=1 Tax=Alteromonas profundi TaxID=2696062 RepID=A0A7X5LPK0_9ALTE|nr:GNAT family N-acetyltransferase [Alteromonas profundi]NDV93189.1 GNAT family N-acetyltransferase [Alteromonas profundi]
MSITCEVGNIDDVLIISSKITEFDKASTFKSLNCRLQDKQTLILVAKYKGKLAGYKLTDTEFYSWLGGVSPDYRNLGIATKLREVQENWASNAGYSSISVKSMNRFSSMIHLLISSGYQINGYEDNGTVDNSKIKFVKVL